MSTDSNSQQLPVTLLSGFLGAGKTTLLKHILEQKTNNGDNKSTFKCAVVVNDVAELNIDKALIDQSSLVQSDEVITMQNGCVCCTLKNDLIAQIIEIASKQTFDYMIIEGSGISEPAEIAKVFGECQDDHDHEEEHGHDEIALHDVARLDTCVTVIDANDFFTKLESIHKENNASAPWCKLLVEQIEYANVILINKIDLVSKEQITKIQEHLELLNPNAKVLISQQSIIDVNEIVDTKMYKAQDFENFMEKAMTIEIPTTLSSSSTILEKVKPCCKESVKKKEKPCCDVKSRIIDSGLSQVILNSKNLPTTRHEARFGITSFFLLWWWCT